MAVTGIPKNKTTKPSKAVDYSEHLTSSPVIAHTTVSTKHKAEPWVDTPSQSETIHKGLTHPGNPIRIDILGGRTINLGNYNSAKIEVKLSVPCGPESLEEAYDWATDWVSEKIASAVEDATGKKG